MAENTLVHKLLGVIGGLGMAFSILSSVGFVHVVNLPPLAWIAISGICGGLGGYGSNPLRLAGLAGGAVAGICLPLALAAYLHFRLPFGDRMIRAEFLIPAAVGALPGVLTYKVVRWAISPPEDEFKTFKEENDEVPEDAFRENR